MPRAKFAARPKSRVVIVLFSLVVFLVSLGSVSQAADLAQKLDEYIRGAEEVWKFSGTVLVAKDGKPVLDRGYGMANYELGVPNTPEMKFLIGSITKQFTATAIMQLAEKQLLDVNDPISKYLPEYPKETGDSITVHHLLTHTSGVPSYTDNAELMGRRATKMSTEEILNSFKDKPLDFPPGGQFKYSNSGYYLLGLIVENVSGKSYEEYLQENIFDPLGMAHTGYGHHRPILPNRAAGYELDENGELVNAGYWHMSAPFAAGALYSTTGDMSIWDQALYTDKVLPHNALKKMFTPHMGNYGYGWGIREVFDRTVISHDGGIDGFSTYFSRWVDDQYCVVVFSNNVNAPVGNMARSLAAIIFDKPYDIPVIKTPIEIDTGIFADYVGVYEVDSTDNRFVTSEDGKLYSQRSGGQRRWIQPEAKDKFFFEYNHTITMTFVRNEQGEVIEHVVHQMGEDGTAKKLSGEKAAKLLAEREPVEVDPKIYDDYVGEFELMPGFIITITVEDDRLFTQATGQEKVEIYPRSETEFFLKVADAQITFVRDDSGEANELILHQGGQEMAAKRVK